MIVRSNVPKRGDVYLIDLKPVVGNEIKDEYRCVVITPKKPMQSAYASLCQITTGGMFVRMAGLAASISGHHTTGVAPCNQVRNIDIMARLAQKKRSFLKL